MNKLLLTLLLASIAGVSGNTYCEVEQGPTTVLLNTGETVDKEWFDQLHPFFEKLCKEQPKNNALCAKLLALAKGVRFSSTECAALLEAGANNPAIKRSVETGKPWNTSAWLHDPGAKITIASLIETENGAVYRNPVLPPSGV